MNNSFKFELNSDGVIELLQSREMQQIISSAADKVKSKAGDGYESSVKVGKKRAYANIAAVSYKARNNNLKNNTLLKALGSSKG